MRQTRSLHLLPTAALGLSLVTTLAAFEAVASATPLNTMFAAATLAAAQNGPYWASVKGDSVMIRCGPSVQSAYAIGRLSNGQPVKVVSVEYGWARVAATGPAFATMFGYIKADGNTSYDAASRTLSVTGKAELLAANMDVGYAPEKSWKLLRTIPTGEKLNVIEVKQAGTESFYAVRLPEATEVWVNNQFIAAMSQAEADAVEASLKGAPTPPAVTPTPTPIPVSPTPTGPTTPANPTTPNQAQPTPAGGPTPGQANPTGTDAVPGTINNNPPSVPAVDPEAERRAAEAKAKAEEERKAAEAAAEERRRQQMERQLRQVTYNDLESKWRRVRNEPAESAELDALRERYLALATDELAPAATRQLATSRAEQIDLRIEAQKALLELAERQRARQKTVEGVADLVLASKQRMPYDAVGRLNASTVYDGDRLPLLYKLADPTNGHTIAYVMPGPNSKPSEALGLVVGLKGIRRYDETLRVNVIIPEMIDVLEKTTSAATSP